MKRFILMSLLLLLCAAPAHAQSFVDDWNTTDTGATDNFACGSPVTVALPAHTVTAGNSMMAAIAYRATGLTTVSVSSVTDDKGDTWNLGVPKDSLQTVELWYANAVVGGSTTVSVTFTAAAAGAFCSAAIKGMQFNGVLGVLDKTATSYASTISPSTGATAITANGNDLVIGAFSGAGTAGVSAGPNPTAGTLTPSYGTSTGYNGLSKVSVATRALELIVAYGFASVRGNYGIDWTTAASLTWYAAIMTLRSSNGGSGAALSSITIAPLNSSVQVGGTLNFTVTGHFSDGSTDDETANCTFHTTDASKASMSGHTATGVAPGTATITATEP